MRLSHPHSRPQLSDVAKGLCYLHSCNVVHGDLKGVRSCSKSRFTTSFTRVQLNILVDGSGHARIADFGLATVTQSLDSIQSPSRQHGYTARWAAPEVLDEGVYSKEADIFAFAMVMIEVHG
jgi:serine/threonine protein kinase